MTAEEKSEKDGKAEMMSELRFLIVADMKGNTVPYVPPNKNTKTGIGISEAMKSDKIDDAETIAADAATAAKLLERIMAM